jgi:hypothetical protein
MPYLVQTIINFTGEIQQWKKAFDCPNVLHAKGSHICMVSQPLQKILLENRTAHMSKKKI